MAQASTIKIQFFASGYCNAHAYIANPVDGKGTTKFYAVWALIHVSDVGYILFDTGYSDEFQKATRSFPERLYRWLTPVFIHPNQTAKALLAALNIEPEDIKYIIISHFHADHIAGIKDFPNAQFLCTKTSYQQVVNTKKWKAVSKGILHTLLPDDFTSRVIFVEDFAKYIFVNETGMTEFQLFENTSFSLILIPGHAKGMLGFIYRSDDQSILYATDASWSYNTYQKGILPHKIVNLFFDSWDDYIDTQNKIRSFEKTHSESKILFTHSPNTLQYIVNDI